MRLKLILPTVDLDAHPTPSGCPRLGCGCRHVVLHQPVPKPLRDTHLDHTSV